MMIKEIIRAFGSAAEIGRERGEKQCI